MNPDNAAVGRAFIMRAIFLYLPERSHLISALYRYAAPAEEAMIFLKAQNLLFIKPHKTASTSVEIALSCASTDPQDIITPLLPEDEEKRAAVGGKLPQNWAWPPQYSIGVCILGAYTQSSRWAWQSFHLIKDCR